MEWARRAVAGATGLSVPISIALRRPGVRSRSASPDAADFHRRCRFPLRSLARGKKGCIEFPLTFLAVKIHFETNKEVGGTRGKLIESGSVCLYSKRQFLHVPAELAWRAGVAELGQASWLTIGIEASEMRASSAVS